jgi:hypothetical protein
MSHFLLQFWVIVCMLKLIDQLLNVIQFKTLFDLIQATIQDVTWLRVNPSSQLCKYQNCTLTLLSDMFTFNLATICCSQGLNFTLFSLNLSESERHRFECWFTLIAAMSCFKVRPFVQLTDSWEEGDVATADVEIAVSTDVVDVNCLNSSQKCKEDLYKPSCFTCSLLYDSSCCVVLS